MARKQFSVHLSDEQMAWAEKVMKEQYRETVSDVLGFLLWCYHNGHVNIPALGRPELVQRADILPPISTADRHSEHHKRKKAG